MDETKFKHFILQTLRDEGKSCVRYDSLRKHPLLQELSCRILFMQSNAKIPATSSRVSSMFSRSLLALVKEGHLFLKDADQDLYEMIDHDLNLGADVLEVIHAAHTQVHGLLVSPNSSQPLPTQPPLTASHPPNPLHKQPSIDFGISEEYICGKVIRMSSYRYVGPAKVIQSIKQLIDRGLVWESSKKEYRPL